ncbi:winged helix-turn-helix domain-containing protein [Zongyangia hominis]|uniref:winged helix-turn-helix domain-containing protein n=1 Tax=Zongyangia hominis TaxID=2763677 RepID=UPI0021CC58AC|nr:winged helix-turn-helix domain-containing protein [Zongyangia hominis]
MRLPYLRQPANFGQTNEEAATHIKRILSFARKERFDEAVAEMANFNGNVVQMFLRRLHTAFDREADVQQTPFVWQIYRDRPQVCYTVAAQIIRKIDGNIYRAGELLPSCQALAKEYGVSSMTMRRTLALLGQIRITETINGVGTRVIPQGCKTPPNFSCPQIQKNLLLFLQAYQLCALTCQDVTKHTFSSMDGHGYRALADQIQKIKEAGQIFLLPGVCIQFIGGRSPSPFIREVYEKLSALLLWGHALRIFDRRPEKNEACSRCAVELEKALECRDVTRIAALIFERLHAGVAASKKLLLQLDFAEKALI